MTKLKIDLEEVYNPRPQVTAEYKKFDFPYWDTASEQNEKRIFTVSKASNNPVKHKIMSIYRKKVGSKEYCFFGEHLTTKDVLNNSVDTTRLVGKYDMPVFTQRSTMVATSGAYGTRTEPAEVESVSTVYEYEFEEIKPLLEEWQEEGIIDENTKYYAWTMNRKYSKPYTYEEFISMDFDSLVSLGQYGVVLSQKDMVDILQQRAKEKAADMLKKLSVDKVENVKSTAK